MSLNNANEIKFNRRRTYLVRTMYGMLWVLLCRETRGRIRIGVFLVEKLQTEPFMPPPDSSSTNMTYQITWSDSEGRFRTLSKNRRVAWSSALKGYKASGITAAPGNVNPFAMIRSRSGRLEICWNYSISNRNRNPNNRLSTPIVRSNARVETVTRPDDQ